MGDRETGGEYSWTESVEVTFWLKSCLEVLGTFKSKISVYKSKQSKKKFVHILEQIMVRKVL